ncbi:glucose-6-phosphatase 3 [Eudromia elegans]
MEALHAGGLRVAQALQSGPPCLERFWLAVTSLADPKSVFTVCFPLAYFLERDVGVAVLWIGLLSEWINVVSKWFLFGERPFWWVHESGLFEERPLSLHQFPVTCETGPGSPSGHCMITGAALWPLVRALTALASSRTRSTVLRLGPFAAYALLLLAVGLSRIFILAHFPHQVVGGILAGAALGWGLQAHAPAARSRRFFACASLALLLGAAGLHRAMTAAGVDVDWSIRLATKWCAEPSWLRFDTRPFTSVCRDAGSALGLGLAAGPAPRLLPRRLRGACAALALLALHLLHGLAPQPQRPALWYGASFLKYAAGPWLVAALVPRLVLRGARAQPRSE